MKNQNYTEVSELVVMENAFNLAIKEWEWTKNAVSCVYFEQENNQRDRGLSREEEASLLSAWPLWVREMLVALNTGMRMGEIISLTRE